MSLLTRISVPAPEDPEAEDIFSSALTTIFTDDAINSWGSPGSSIIYKSPLFGAIELRVPIHPDEEQGRKLFAHYLWNAGVVAADAIESASNGTTPMERLIGTDDVPGDWDKRFWNVRDKRVLEIGAATALPSLITALSSASVVTITDHPSSPALTAGSIEQNVRANLYHNQTAPSSNSDSTGHPRGTAHIGVFGHTWGTDKFYSASQYGRSIPASQLLDSSTATDDQPLTAVGYPMYDKVIVADCLWMPSQHSNIIKTITNFLSPKRTECSPSESCALVIAGFHTGRAIVRNFFALATGHESLPAESAPVSEDNVGELTTSELKLAQIFETDTSGNRRDWTWDSVREGEGKWEAKRWCVVGVLVRV